MAKRKTRSYTVGCEVKVRASVTVAAASLEEALAEARKLSVPDFVTPTEGCFDDYEDFELTGVY